MKRLASLLSFATLVACAAPAVAQNQAQMFGRTVAGASRSVIVADDGSMSVGPSSGPLVDGSAVITTANTAQTVFAANPARRYLFCMNPATATEVLLMDVTATVSATTSYEIQTGGSNTFASGFVPNGAVTVRAATVGHRFVCKQG